MEKTLSEEEDEEILMPAPMEQLPNPAVQKSFRLERRDSRNSDINKPYNTADKAELQGVAVLAPQIIH